MVLCWMQMTNADKKGGVSVRHRQDWIQFSLCRNVEKTSICHFNPGCQKKRKLSGKYKIKKGNEYMSFSSPVFCLQTIMNKKKNQEFDHVYSLDIIKGHYGVLEKKFKSSILMR